jgi:hypothetical protein
MKDILIISLVFTTVNSFPELKGDSRRGVPKYVHTQSIQAASDQPNIGRLPTFRENVSDYWTKCHFTFDRESNQLLTRFKNRSKSISRALNS